MVDLEIGFFMFDGDRIFLFNVLFIGDFVWFVGFEEDLCIGVVQIVYVNGVSMVYIERYLQFFVVCMFIGVKYFYYVVCQFDVGVYFEVNGYGMVVFFQDVICLFKEKEFQFFVQKDVFDMLVVVVDLINQIVGDVIFDMFMVEVIFVYKGWILKDWVMIYIDLFNCFKCVVVVDKDIFKMIDVECCFSYFKGVQDSIDECVKKYINVCVFVCVSGMENVCCVYVEVVI